MASYRVEPRPEWGGYVVLRPDGSTLCGVESHATKAAAIAEECAKLRTEGDALWILAAHVAKTATECPYRLIDCHLDPDEYTCDDSEIRDCWITWARREAGKRDG
ncbi:MAG TPA: hypothetical protein PLF11_00075 [Bacillota bacterium]|nr:hypothetical protein [Dermatophilaceae bacterium]HOI35755.1 hypothetical protein [Bacillota bacterium]